MTIDFLDMITDVTALQLLACIGSALLPQLAGGLASQCGDDVAP